MFRKLAFVLIVLSGFTTFTLWASEVPAVATATSPEVVAPTEANGWKTMAYPLVIAAGAVAGVVATNTLTYGVGTIPYWVGITTTAPIVSPAAAAASRIFVITSGVLGAWIADAIYNTATQ